MAKDRTYKSGSTIKIKIGGVPDLSYINQPRHAEIHEFETPPIPYDADILFSDLPKKEQFWRRIPYPEEFHKFVPGVTETTEEEAKNLLNFIKIDRERRIKGIWFMNNGIPTYLTGHNYFFLQWCDMISGNANENDQSYPDYRKFQRDFFYFIDICEKEKECLGGYVAKAKKVGVTQMMSAFYTNVVTLHERKILGVISKTADECEATNMAMIKHIVSKMPQIILPKMGKSNNMEVFFGHPNPKPTGTVKFQQKLQDLKEQRVLNSRVVGQATKVGCFDGPKYSHAWADEFPKYYQSVKISPKELFEKDSAAVKMQQQITGKFWITAYTPEVDDRGFIEARTIYYDSQKLTIKPDSILKRTKSSLFCYHISSLLATESTFDIYGEADVEKAFRINDEERKEAEGDSNKLQALIRQGARNHDESFMIGGSGSVFDNNDLQKSINEKERLDFMRVVYKRRGNLRWTGERLRSPVEFVDDIKGKWHITRSLPENYLNAWSIPADGQIEIVPDPTVNFVGGIDPPSYMDKDIEGKVGGSKGVSYTMSLPNLALDNYYDNLNPGDVYSKRIMGWYSARPQSINELFEDIIMDILYFGKRVIIENNKEWLVTRLKDVGLKQFLLLRNTETKVIEKYHPLKKQKEVSTQKGDVEELCRIVDEYLTSHKNGGENYCLFIESVELLTQLMSLDPLNTKPFDHFMSFAYTLMAVNSFNLTKRAVAHPSIKLGDMWQHLHR